MFSVTTDKDPWWSDWKAVGAFFFTEIELAASAGAATAGECVLCAAGTYQTGSGPPWQHGLPAHLVLSIGTSSISTF
jgi:hypothetical protein